MSAEARALADAHRAAQNRLAAETAAQVTASWALLDPARVDDTAERWLRVAVPVVAGQHRASSSLAAAWLRAHRSLSVPGRAPAAPRAVFSEERAVTSLTVTGPVRLKTATARGLDLAEASRNAAATTSRAAMRLALDGGRDTIRAAAQTDPRRTGWERALSGEPCDFCQALAAEAAAGDDSAAFVSHDGCGCEPVPVYG